MGLRRLVVLLVPLCVACGRTEPVRYPYDTTVIGEDGGDPRQRGPDGGILCIEGSLGLIPAQPVVTLVVDRSNSMNQRFAAGSATKWNALKAALRTSLPPWNQAFELGLHIFPISSRASCDVSAGPTIAPALGNVDAIITTLNQTGPGGATPTALAVESAAAALSGLRTASTAKALILATDGAPDCSFTLDPATCTCLGTTNRCTQSRCLDDARTIERIAAAGAMGIPTWVIGIQSDEDSLFIDTLNRMAVAGGRPQSGTQRFFSARSESELETAFTLIGQQVGDCHYLTASVPDLGGSIEVDLNGEFIGYDVALQDGWAWVDSGNGELALYGTACERAKAAAQGDLTVVVRCSAQ